MERFFTPKEVAARYGVKVITVWEWIRLGKLKAYRIGRLYRIHEDQLEAFEAAAERGGAK